MTMRRLAEDVLAWIVAGIVMWFVMASYVHAITQETIQHEDRVMRSLRVYSDDSTCEGWEFLDSTGEVPKFDQTGF